MENFKSQRQRRLGNVQKQLLNNYYLQKYNSLISKISNQPENRQKIEVTFKPKEPVKNNRTNFKNMILLKKNDNQNISAHSRKNVESEIIIQKTQLKHKLSGREEQQNQKIMKKLEESIINQLYQPSPTKMQEGSYKRIEIINKNNSQSNQLSSKIFNSVQLQQNIQVTYEEQFSINEFQEDTQSQHLKDSQISKIKQAIRQSFSRRKERSSSPKKSNQKKRQYSQVKSSQISIEIKIQSPNKLDKKKSEHKFTSERQNNNFRLEVNRGSSNSNDEKIYYNKSFDEENPPQVHFSQQQITPLHQEEQIIDHKFEDEQHIQFVPPSSNYYKSDNENLVEQSFKYQEKIRSMRDKDSEKAQSVVSSQKNSANQHKIERKSSKKSLKSRQMSEYKDTSKLQMSFVSRISMLSSEEGLMIKQKIEKQLYENQMGPYQSALYNIVELMGQFPRSGPVYAVGQKTLDDRKSFEQRRITQEKQMIELQKNIQKLKRKAHMKALKGEDEIIRNNKLQILKSVRKLTVKL